MPRKKAIPSRQVNFRLDLDTFKTLKKFARIKKSTRTNVLTALIRTYCQ